MSLSARSSSGPGQLVLIQQIMGSTPIRATLSGLYLPLTFSQ